LWPVSADGIRIVFGRRMPLTPAAVRLLAGFYIVQGLGILAGGAAAETIGPRSPSAWPAWWV
jgi:hypothetical protein